MGQCIHRFYSQAFDGTNIISIEIPKSVVLFGSDVFEDTPCSDSSIFQPGTAVENCKIVSTVSSTTASSPTTSSPTTSVPTIVAPTTSAAVPTTTSIAVGIGISMVSVLIVCVC